MGDTRIMADETSNTIIVIARPSMHPVYEKLIKRLDVRRPQVLIEATLVTLDTTNEFKLGVEFAKTSKVDGGKGKAITFSQFGLSTADPSTGSITLKPGVGFNGALISTDIANVILQALKNDQRVHVQAQPTVLVNDNATGKLISQQEEPYVTVNASNQVALNTFGGYSSAGTNITIKPQISEGDNLKLEYEITLSSFNGTGSAGLPPARQTNSLKSEVTIPNGNTIVLGGLTRDTQDDDVDRIPVLGEIPILEYAFSNRRNTVRKSTLFIFIHAVILRADKFEDLKVLSNDAARNAGLPSDFPTSDPVGIR
jgi:general secretion pathway protein D